MMKVLYCNPVFFEYRLPFYKELVKLFEGNFYVMYSPVRYKICKKAEFCEQIKQELGENAVPLYTDHVYDTYSRQWDEMPDIEKGKRIPFTSGLMRAIRKIKPDVIITEGFFQWTPLVVLYGILFRKPVYIGYERTCHTERNTGKLKTWHRKLTDKFVRGYLVNGSEAKKYLMSIGVKEEKIHIGGMSADSKGLVEGIVSLTEEEKDAFKRTIVGERKGIVYLFSGRVSMLKGADLLLAAWEKHIKRYSQDHIVFVGYGDKSEELKQKYKNELSIHFEGRVHYSEMYKYYAIADVFVLPTIEDNWSLVVPEAMACGLPIATSIYNGCYPELVHKDVNGITFDTFKQETIVDALGYFHHQDLKKMGEASIRLEKPFNTENCAKRVYETVIIENGIC